MSGVGKLEAIWIKRFRRGGAYGEVLNDGAVAVGCEVSFVEETA